MDLTKVLSVVKSKKTGFFAAVVLFGIILVLTFVQRKLTGRKDG